MFQAEAIGVEGALGERPVVHFVHDGYREKLSCEWVAGCDGFHGIARHVVPASTRRVYEHEYPYSWLGVLAEVTPSWELIYARGEHGFALHSMRPPDSRPHPSGEGASLPVRSPVSRLHLQVPNGTDPAEWPDVRVVARAFTELYEGGKAQLLYR